jgi:ribosomal protein L11 methyltransferase
MQDFVEVNFNCREPVQEILIARLSRLGYEGFEQEDNFLKAYSSADTFDDSAVKRIAADHQVSFTISTVEPENWNAAWESNYQPVSIEDFAGIRADFHSNIPGVQHEIIITPKMSFGTGHHATTQLMISAMRKIEFSGKSVLDFGTGTGILAILAEKLGAGEILAIDNDAWSIENAAENLQKNATKNISLNFSSQFPEGKTFDIILANINKHVITENVMNLAGALKINGKLLVSGILTVDEEELVSDFKTYSINCREKTVNNEWICLRFEHDF